MNEHLVRAIADLALFLEGTDDALLDPDAAVSAMEQLASRLQQMSPAEQASVAAGFRTISGEYASFDAEFVASLPETLGLADAL